MTVVMLVKQKVVVTFAFRGRELTDEAVTQVLQAVSRLVEKKP